MISDVGLTGSSKKSGYYLDGIRQKDRFDNDNLVDQLEQRIRAKAKMLDKENQINIKEID